MSFPSQQVGTSSAPVGVVVTNVGNAPLNLQAGVSGPQASEFAVSGCAGPVLPGQQCTVSTVFTPIGQGVTPRSGVLFLSDAQGAATTVQVPFSTALVLPLDFDPRAVTFPATPVGRVSAPVTIRARNYNTVETPVESYRLDTGDFAVTAFTCSPKMASGAYCEITVLFQPTKTGAIAADLVVFGPFYGTPAQEVVKLSGTGGAPSAVDDVGSVRAGATVTVDPRANDRDPAGAVAGPADDRHVAVGRDGDARGRWDRQLRRAAAHRLGHGRHHRLLGVRSAGCLQHGHDPDHDHRRSAACCRRPGPRRRCCQRWRRCCCSSGSGFAGSVRARGSAGGRPAPPCRGRGRRARRR